MFTSVEALCFRSLKCVRQPLGPFHVLVGPNASGKTTFLDVIAFLGQLVANGLEAAISERTSNFVDLLWQRSGSRFELAVEAALPDHLRSLSEPGFRSLRYEVAIGTDPDFHEVTIQDERVLLQSAEAQQNLRSPPELFPSSSSPPQTILSPERRPGTRTIINRALGRDDRSYYNLYSEPDKGGAPAFRLDPRKSSLSNLPEVESMFPVSIWLKQLLATGVQQLVLNSLAIRKASPPGQSRTFKPDGTNLPWLIDRLRRASPPRFADWIAHLKTALPDLEDVDTIEREDDRHRYLVLRYQGGLTVPSWMTSDGTLRLLALTLPAYLPDFTGVYLIEEPENGIHPRAVETMYQSLSSVYGAQILMATHSPVILSLVEPAKVLCFAKNAEGATDIVLGSDHPALKEWKGETTLGTLFAAGVLG